MKLSRVKIQNFRSIKELEFSIEDLCALIGPNNAGKSNILNALAFVLGETWPTSRIIEPSDFYAYSEDDMVITLWFDEEREVKGDIGEPVKYSGIQFKIDRYKRKTGKKEPGDLKSTFVCVNNVGNPVTVLRKPNPQSKPYSTPASVTADIRDEIPAVIIDVDRNARYHLSSSSRSIFGRLLTDLAKELKKDSARFQAFKDKYDETRKLLRTDGFNELEKNIREQLKRHTGLQNLTLQLDGLDPINLYKNFSILFTDPDTPEPVNFERMGSGVQSALVMSLLQAYREMKKENAILLFEEPELYLHPHGRRHLFRLIKELSANGVQIIYTTHSQDFVDLNNFESARLVYKTKDTGTKIKMPDMTKVKGNWKSQVKHIAEPKNESFFARKVVIVEGATECFAIKRLAEMMEPALELDLNDCSIIEAGGKPAIPVLIKIMAALDKPVFVIYDTDLDKANPQDSATNKERENSIKEAAKVHGAAVLYQCDPYFEATAGIKNARMNDKPEQMIEHLEAAGSWTEVAPTLKELMEEVSKFIKS